jgi:hypothetical protein
VEAARFFEIIDLEKYCVTVDLERTKVIFLVWVVGVAEVIVDGKLSSQCVRLLRRPASRANTVRGV